MCGDEAWGSDGILFFTTVNRVQARRLPRASESVTRLFIYFFLVLVQRVTREFRGGNACCEREKLLRLTPVVYVID